MPERAFHGVLFDRPEHETGVSVDEPATFVDLHLDQVLAVLVDRREEYELQALFESRVRDPTIIHYRHEVLRDLERPDVLGAVRAFAAAMTQMRAQLEQSRKLHDRYQRHAWFVDAVETYCEGARRLAEQLTALAPASRGLRGLHEYLEGYLGSRQFVELASENRRVKEALAAIRYRVHISGLRVTVSRYEDDPDYSAEVAETFARFRQGRTRSYLVNVPDHAEMNQVEARILALVARLHPEPFALREEFCTRHRAFLDDAIARFDREVQLYVSYLELVQRLRAAGLSFCYPQVSADEKEVSSSEAFDLALAIKLVADEQPVVCNGFHLSGPERMLVVGGPNNGGKTTFARMVGQLHHLAGAGLLVPGREARLFLTDHVFTHFERREDIETLRGKFDDELVRVHAILEQATPSSIVVMNESFSSTSLTDALYVGTEVVRRMLTLGCLGVYVTFVDEIASLSEATVSMVAQIVPENPAERTFKVVRQPAEGLAYAWAIADKYGLSYERLMERIG